MAIFRRRRPAAEPVAEERGLIWPGYPGAPSGFGLMNTAAGVAVDAQSALTSAAAWACQRVLAATITSLPVDVYRIVGGRRQEVNPQPLIVRNPSGNVSIRRRAWVGQAVRSLLSSGNIYADVLGVDPVTMRPTQLEIIDPAQVKWLPTADGIRPTVGGKVRDVWPRGDLWHVPASQFMAPGAPYALSPTDYAKTSIGTSIAAEEFGAKFFADGAHPTLIVKSSGEMTSDQAAAAKNRVIEATRGNREPLVVGSAWSFEKLAVDPKDSQFIELLRFEVEQACRFWGVPPSMVYSSMSGQAVTYQNIGQADTAYLKHSVSSWLVDLEDAWSELTPQPQFVKFNVNALLRMDAEARWAIYAKRLDSKTMSVNEVRTLEDEAPIPDPEFDRPGIPGGIELPAKPAHVTPPPEDAGGTAS